jgi:hypothetical protein
MSIKNEPHYTIPSTELAGWIEEQGTDRWWNVDGDRVLIRRLMLPCPGDELANALRTLNKPLLIHAGDKNPLANGERITKEKVTDLVRYFGDNLESKTGSKTDRIENRVLILCWEGSDDEWLLVEDVETTASEHANALANGG